MQPLPQHDNVTVAADETGAVEVVFEEPAAA